VIAFPTQDPMTPLGKQKTISQQNYDIETTSSKLVYNSPLSMNSPRCVANFEKTASGVYSLLRDNVFFVPTEKVDGYSILIWSLFDCGQLPNVKEAVMAITPSCLVSTDANILSPGSMWALVDILRPSCSQEI
jgi:hypothetical protein